MAPGNSEKTINIRKVEARHRKPKDMLYVVFEDLNFAWMPGELEKVKAAWEAGMHIVDIAREVDRQENEVAILVMDLAEKGRFRPREGGAYGR